MRNFLKTAALVTVAMMAMVLGAEAVNKPVADSDACVIADGVQATDTASLVKLGPTRATASKDTVKVARARWTNFAVEIKNDTTLTIEVRNNNGRHFGGRTFRNAVVIFDACGVPLAKWYGEKGVNGKGWKGYKTGKTRSEYVVGKDLIDRTAYMAVYSDDDGNSRRFEKWARDMGIKMVEKGLLDLSSMGAKTLGKAIGLGDS